MIDLTDLEKLCFVHVLLLVVGVAAGSHQAARPAANGDNELMVTSSVISLFTSG